VLLKIKGIEDVGDDRRIYSITADGGPAKRETLESVARIASRLVKENALPGSYQAGDGSSIVLSWPSPTARSFTTGSCLPRSTP
jgi:hypothetical protein